MPQEPCKACGRPKPVLAVEQGDDFCSTECARHHYGTAATERARVAVLARRASIRGTSWRRPSAFPNGRKP
jgi:endogenous inhibitor of DNA gyrase (YacG/DUF329 family)